MTEPRSKYQQVILRDVRSLNYGSHRRAVWWVFGIFGTIFTVVYVAFFHFGLRFRLHFLLDMNRLATSTQDSTLKTLVYNYEHLLLLVGFLGLLSVFGTLLFLAYDMQHRNEIIRSLLSPAPEAPPRPHPVGESES